MKKLFTSLVAACALTLPFSAQAATKTKICVFDIVGNVGPMMGAMKDWQAAALGWGLEAELIPYTNEAIAAEDLKARAADAEAAYDKALADARSEAQRIAGEARADIQADLDAAIAQADADIAERTAESEKAIADIRAGALEAVNTVARDTASELVAALGGTPDADAIGAAVDTRIKG